MGETKINGAAIPAVEELYPGYREELRRSEARHQKMEQAAANPLPGPLFDAYAHLPETIAGLTIRPLVHYDFVLLKQLDSPLLRHLRAATDGAETPPTPYGDDEGYELIFLFTRPARDAAAILARGRSVFRRAAVEMIGMNVSPADTALLMKAVEREVLRAFATVVNYEPRAPADGTVFTPPPAAPATDSAGGSTISAG